ncbi:MAG: site-2 protease family protein [Pirellulales bacterium]|nr:site-2 protease family protein [Pirellulales bacterium]
MMNSWKLGKLAGIGVHVHWSFFILPALVVFATLAGGGGATAALWGVALIAAVFACVVLHELGHALMARRYGIGTRDITLLPIGGVARLERIPEKPSQEIAVALAGPAVNVAIAAALWCVLALLGTVSMWIPMTLIGGSFLAQLLWINVLLVAFNLLPAFPMDGGRVLRAALATRLSRVRATQIAANIATAFAVVFGVMGFFGNPMLIVIAIFVFLAARAEAQFVERSAETRLPAEARAIDAGSVLFEPDLDEFEVVRDDEVIGKVTKADLLRLLCTGEGQRTLADVIDKRPGGSAPAA